LVRALRRPLERREATKKGGCPGIEATASLNVERRSWHYAFLYEPARDERTFASTG
jgi:hypothetical protein